MFIDVMGTLIYWCCGGGGGGGEGWEFGVLFCNVVFIYRVGSRE